MIIFKNKLILPHVAHELCKDAKVKNKNITCSWCFPWTWQEKVRSTNYLKNEETTVPNDKYDYILSKTNRSSHMSLMNFTKMIKFQKISDSPGLFKWTWQKKVKLKIPTSQNMKSQQYQIMMIIFSQKRTDPPTCRSWTFSNCPPQRSCMQIQILTILTILCQRASNHSPYSNDV